MKQQYKIFFTHFILLFLFGCTSTTKQKPVVLQQPPKIISVAEVSHFANEAAIDAYSYSYKNYEKHVSHMSQYFTPTGLNAYQKAFLTSGNIEIVKDQKLVVSAVATKAPIMIRKGYVDLIYGWEVEVPLLVTYQNKTQLVQRPINVNMTLVQVLPNINSRGVAINRFVAQSKQVIKIKAKN